jgi:hypothetical protein
MRTPVALAPGSGLVPTTWVPAHLDDSGAFIVGQDSAPVVVEIYYDYMCPACGAMEKVNGAELDRLMQDGTIRIALRPISFLDRQSQGTRYSARAANAFATVVNDAPVKAWAFHTALYAAQPEEGSEGLSDAQIKDIATGAGGREMTDLAERPVAVLAGPSRLSELRHSSVTVWVTMLVASIASLVASLVLSIDALALAKDPNAALSCNINSVISCGTVGTSWQASLLGFPNAFLGLICEPVVITIAIASLGAVRFPRWFMVAPGDNAGLLRDDLRQHPGEQPVPAAPGAVRGRGPGALQPRPHPGRRLAADPGARRGLEVRRRVVRLASRASGPGHFRDGS